MAEVDVGIRDLRNNTSAVLDAVEAGDEVYLTKRGRRVAVILPLGRDRRIDRLLAAAAQRSTGDSGAHDELMASKRADLAAERAQADPWA